jgi:hypothetical protein
MKQTSFILTIALATLFTSCDKAQETATKAANASKEAAGKAADTMKSAADSAKDSAGEMMTAAKAKLADFGGAELNSLVQGAEKAISTAKTAGGDQWAKIKDQVGPMIEKIKALAAALPADKAEAIKAKIKELMTSIGMTDAPAPAPEPAPVPPPALESVPAPATAPAPAQ